MERSEIKFTLARIEKCKRHELDALDEAKNLFDEIKNKFYTLFNIQSFDINENIKENKQFICATCVDRDIVIYPTAFHIQANGNIFFEGYGYDTEIKSKFNDITGFGNVNDYLIMCSILMEKINKTYGTQYGTKY